MSIHKNAKPDGVNIVVLHNNNNELITGRNDITVNRVFPTRPKPSALTVGENVSRVMEIQWSEADEVGRVTNFCFQKEANVWFDISDVGL